MKEQITVNIPDGDYCESSDGHHCQFMALNGCEDPICTLFRSRLESACEYYRSLHGDCDGRICIDCENLEFAGTNAKCAPCRVISKYYRILSFSVDKKAIGHSVFSSRKEPLADYKGGKP